MEPIIIVAIITGMCSVLGQLIISIYTANKTKAVTDLRLDIIESKLDKHNHFMERIAALEVNAKNFDLAIQEIKDNCRNIHFK